MIGLLKPYWTRWLDRRIPAASSVSLNQRKIFIRPTRIGAAYVLLLLLMLLAAINYQNSLAYGLTFLLGAVFVVAILHTYRNLAGLILRAGGADAVFLGEQGRFHVRLESSRRAHQAIGLGWPKASLQLVDVPPRGTGECQLSLPTRRRGWLRPERLRVESRFPLGILVAWSWLDLDQALLVYPRPLAGELPLSSGGGDEQQEQGRQVRGQGCDDFLGLRDYQPGDSKQRLDWKAYSRGQGLLVKDFATLSGRDPQLDFAMLEGDVETRLSLLCHWVLQLSARQQPFALRLPGQTLAPDGGEAHRDACLRALALYGAAP
ncbi:DUF58 domain-containing protein [Pseudomonas benzenivorans]|uniref:DUF58 domain-containing protein n=1 Tax=Pseudomonas benzenivorans TaxID=556533 RepID=A0ABZ0Q234_9PSED|nr:DUF58 domain-containing protein [Pseudomonas benzenivorans]WPC07031.1 DUF58 domain-containing protein [Pseudomonas benzenivorans]